MTRRLFLLLAVLCLVVAPWAEAAAPVFENQDSGAVLVTSVISLANLTVSSSANRVLWVAAYFESTRTVSQVQWNPGSGNVALTFYAAQNTGGAGFERIELWRLINPGSASPGTVTVTLTGSSSTILGCAVVYKDEDQTTPAGTAVTTPGNNTAPTTTVSSATGETVVGVFGIVDSTGFAITGGQTNRCNASSGTERLRVDDAAGVASVTESYSTTNSFRWATIGAALKPVGGGGATRIRHRGITQ